MTQDRDSVFSTLHVFDDMPDNLTERVVDEAYDVLIVPAIETMTPHIVEYLDGKKPTRWPALYANMYRFNRLGDMLGNSYSNKDLKQILDDASPALNALALRHRRPIVIASQPSDQAISEMRYATRRDLGLSVSEMARNLTSEPVRLHLGEQLARFSANVCRKELAGRNVKALAILHPYEAQAFRDIFSSEYLSEQVA